MNGGLRRTAQGLALLALLAIPEAAALGWDDSGPAGTSSMVQSLAADHRVRILDHSFGPVAEGGAGDALLVFPDSRASNAVERAAALSFVVRGGFMVLATEGGHGDAWLADIGLRLHDVPVRRLGASGCIPATLPVPSGSGPEACLPGPTAFPEVQRTVGVKEGLAREPVFLDLDRDGNLSLGDPEPRLLALALLLPHGDGWVLVVADAQAWTNGGDPGGMNAAALRAMVAPHTGTVYVDSTSDRAAFAVAPLHRALDAPALRQAFAVGAVIASLAVAVFARTSLPSWGPHETRPLAEDPETETAIRFLSLGEP